MPERLHSLTDITLYYLNNLLNFNNYISQSHKLMGGLSTFGGVINAIHLDGLFTNKINLMDYTWASSLQFNWLTTGTYLKNGFIDYGNYGVITGPFVLSFFSTYFWKKAKLKRNAILSLYLFLLLWVEISLSFFTNYLTDNEILPNLIVIIVVITLCKNKEVRNV